MSTEAGKNVGVKVKKDRSPNYPLFGLQKAVGRAQELYAKYKRSSVPVHLAHELWEYKAHSGVGNQCVAALSSYGLIDIEGVGELRRVKLTDAAYQIIMDAPARPELSKKAAVEPPMHRELWERYRSEEHFPDDKLIRNYLLFEREAGHFNENTVDSFIENFRSSLRYAGLLAGDIIEESTAVSRSKVNGGEVEPRKWPDPLARVKVGDLVQWTCAGSDMFAEPRPIRKLSEDGEWAYVPGTETGLPLDQLTVVSPAMVKEKTPPANPYAAEAPDNRTPPMGFKEYTYDLAEGRAMIRWPDKLNKESVDELKDWFDLMIRKIQRMTKTKSEDGV